MKDDKVLRSFFPGTVLLMSVIFFFSVLRNGIPWILGAGIYGVFLLTVLAVIVSAILTYVLVCFSINKLNYIWRV